MPVRKILFTMSCLFVASGAYGQAPAPHGLPPGSEPAGVSTSPHAGGAMPPQGGPSTPPAQPYVTPQFDPNHAGFAQPGPGDLPPIPNSWIKSAWNPQPIIEVRAEALWLKPDFPDSIRIGQQVRPVDNLNYEVGDVMVNANTNYIAAARTTLELHVNPNFSIEASGFVMDGPSKTGQPFAYVDLPVFLDASVINPNIAPEVIETLPPGFAIDSEGNALRRGFLENLPPGFPSEAEEMTLDWDFRTSGADFTFLHHWIPLKGHVSDLSVGLGARYLNVREAINVHALDDIDPNNIQRGTLRSSVGNDLAGPQVMARARVQGPGFRLRSVAEIKIGLLASDTRATNSVFVDGEMFSQGRYTRVLFGSLFESNFYVEYFATENLSLYGGFQLFYVDRILRASEQITQDVDRFTIEHKDLGSLFMFGPRAGVVFSY